MSNLFWPLSFDEMNLAGDIHLGTEDIDSFCYPPGQRERYTNSGWIKALKMRLGTQTPLDVRDFGASVDA